MINPLKWEQIAQQTFRLKVYGGWLVTYHTGIRFVTTTFIEDMDYDWNLLPIKEQE